MGHFGYTHTSFLLFVVAHSISELSIVPDLTVIRVCMSSTYFTVVQVGVRAGRGIS